MIGKGILWSEGTRDITATGRQSMNSIAHNEVQRAHIIKSFRDKIVGYMSANMKNKTQKSTCPVLFSRRDPI